MSALEQHCVPQSKALGMPALAKARITKRILTSMGTASTVNVPVKAPREAVVYSRPMA